MINLFCVLKLYGLQFLQKDNLDKMDTFLEHRLPKIESWKDRKYEQMYNKEIESVIEKLTTKKTSASDGFTGELYQKCKDEWAPILLDLIELLIYNYYVRAHMGHIENNEDKAACPPWRG